jgi:hypothetical protein
VCIAQKENGADDRREGDEKYNLKVFRIAPGFSRCRAKNRIKKSSDCRQF